MRDRRLMTKAKLKESQMQNRAHEDLIRNIASSADSAVLSFHDSILLRNMWGGKLLINTMLKAKLIKRGIPELSPIVTVNSF
jgi:hypothetical protein